MDKEISFINLLDYNISNLEVNHMAGNEYIEYENNNLIPTIINELNNNHFIILFTENESQTYKIYYFISLVQELENEYCIQFFDFGVNVKKPCFNIYNLQYKKDLKRLYVYNSSLSFDQLIVKNSLIDLQTQINKLKEFKGD